MSEIARLVKIGKANQLTELIAALDLDYDQKREKFGGRRVDTYAEGYLDGMEFAMNKMARVAAALLDEVK